MKVSTKKGIVEKDDTLYGLLLPYKVNNTYFKILECEVDGKVVLQIASNPAYWNDIKDDSYEKYKILRRLDVDYFKLSVKFINPLHIITVLGPLLGIKVLPGEFEIVNNLDKQARGYYIVEFHSKHRLKVLQKIKKILKLTPQKKYEMLEKYMTLKQES